MAECIDRDAAVNGLAKIINESDMPEDWNKGMSAAMLALFRIPAADVRPVVRAVWRRYSPFTDTYECSNCGEQVIDQQFRTNFCPNCGADMREETA